MSDVKIIELELDKISPDGRAQSRVSIENKVVEEYAQRMIDGDIFPPLVVFFDGVTRWLAAGFHRFYAYEKIRRDAVSVEQHIGTGRDATLFSLGANDTHGLRRTNADKRKAVNTMLTDIYWSQWSNREIAKRCGVSESMVRRIRIYPKDQPRKFITGHGAVAEMRVGNIGKNQRRKQKPLDTRISVSLLKRASEIVRDNGREYAEALAASLNHYLEVTHGPQEVKDDATADCTSGS